MKIAVYSIALNEEKHVKRWFDSAKGADLILIADTGSTDKTRELARALGIAVYEISVKPWRFDVARNASLALIPEDIDLCIQLDLDEVLQENWRPVLEEAWAEGNIWPIYTEVLQRKPDGSIARDMQHFRIHPREGFLWKYPIHELVTPKSGAVIERKVIDLTIDHIADPSKSRKSYLDLLELAVLESPNDWRMNHYLNREYFYVQNWVKVLSSAYKAMEIGGGWDVERASTCMWASEAAKNLEFGPLMKEWAERATIEAPEFYEAWHWRAHVAHLKADWNDCYTSASMILNLSRQKHHLVKPEIWDWWGYDLIALSAHNLGNVTDAIKYGQLALKNAPEIDRLSRNMEFYEKGALSDKTSLLALNPDNPVVLIKNNSIRVLDSFYIPFSRWDYMSDHMLHHGSWDIDLTNWLLKNIEAGWTCLNVGSNSGYFLEVMSRITGASGKVIGIEPNFELVKKYRESQALNSYLNCAPITIHEVANGSKKGKVNLSIPNGNLGGANISIDLNKSLMGFKYPREISHQIEVPIIPLSELVDQGVDFILMDVEGSEPEVFEGFSESLRETKLIIIETGSYHSKHFLEYISSKYLIQDLFGNDVVIESIQNLPLGTNINVLLTLKN